MAIIPYFLIQYVRKETKKYKLIKNFDLSNVNSVIIPPVLQQKYDAVDFSKIQPLFRNIVKRFVRIIEEKIPKDFLTNFYNNINETNISFYPMIKASERYYSHNNQIKLSMFYLTRSLNHELLHLASRSIRGKEGDNNYSVNSGFHHANYYSDIGRGINEGYTVCLDRKYFSKFHMETRTYNLLATIAKLTETIVGEKKDGITLF